jgi:hypothetical protein
MDDANSDSAGDQHVTRTQLAALTIIAAALIVGTVAFGVLRIYA